MATAWRQRVRWWYRCWNCGLGIGPDDGLELPSRLCPVCRAAMGGDRHGD